MKLDATGVRLSILLGQPIPLPPSPDITRALESAEVAISDSEPSGFSILFKSGRTPALLAGAPLLSRPALKAGSRVVLTALAGVKSTVLIDGVIEDAQFDPGDTPGAGSLTIKGRDLTALMDKEERQESYPGLGPLEIVLQILSRYARYGIIPDVRPPLSADRNSPVEETIMQTGTDLAMIRELSEQYDHIFTVIPGPLPGASRFYWGPPLRLGKIQSAITVDMGSATNVSGLKFENVQNEAARVEGDVLDPTTGAVIPVQSFSPIRLPLSAQPAISALNTVGRRILRPESGQSASQAMAQAQAQSDATTDTLKVTGELSLGKYGKILEPRRLVGIRGAGLQHDGLFYVKDVVHTIAPGSWTQAFSGERDGLGTTVPAVPV